MRAKNCVCIGSGGGFIPRLMTKARLDLHEQEILVGNRDYNCGDIEATYLVDACNGVGGACLVSVLACLTESKNSTEFIPPLP